MNPFDAWLDARDAAALHAAWTELAPTTTEVGPVLTNEVLGSYRTGPAAAQLAAVWLGMPIEKLAWLGAYSDNIDSAGAPTPIYKAARMVKHSFLETTLDMHEECYENWEIREVRAGKRGVQRVSVDWGIDDGTREGANSRGEFGIVVRCYDREKQIGVVVTLHRRTVSLIGEPDIDWRAALDLFDFNPGMRMPAWTTFDLERARGLIAQLATEIDAHYDQSASWTARELHRNESSDSLYTETRYENGPHAVHIVGRRNSSFEEIEVRLEGLPWGQQLRGSIRFTPEGAWVHFNARFPEDIATRLLARMRSTEGAVLT